MSTAARLAAFGAVLALIFAGATVVGGAAHVKRSEPPPEAGHGGEEMAMAAKPVRGLAVSDDGLTLEVAHRADELRFRIADRLGRTVRDFDVEHTKRMHLIVVRRDLTGFQHLHPRQAADGTWSVALRLRDAGSYRVFADFSRGGEAHTLAGDVTVDGPLRTVALPAPAPVAEVDGMQVRLDESAIRAGAESALRFSVTRDGRPVQVQDYLGAKGHLVALREGDLAFLHVHPDARSLRFEATFPTAGRYRLFLQFQTDGRVHTAAFTQEVTR
jgi:ribosomal protein S18 acetylase RimI-like enzyme